jgi:hypothetical protein
VVPVASPVLLLLSKPLAFEGGCRAVRERAPPVAY